MYQGKFDAQAKGQQNPAETLEQILKERDEAIARRAARKAASRTTAPKSEDAPKPKTAPAAAKPIQPKPAKAEAAPAKPVQPKPAKAEAAPAKPVKPAAEKKAPAPKPVKAENQKAQPVKKQGPRMGGVIFYTVYFLFIFAFFVGIFGVLNWLNGWLKAYEAAQPTIKCEEVFNQLFRNPDWAQLYRLANVEDTQFEGVDEYVAYMENKVAGQELNYVETSAGIGSNKKFIVRLGTEKLATFMLEGQSESLIDIPDWKLGPISLYLNRDESITIKKLENHVAYVNGVPLDDSYTIQIASTKADDMLPAGTPKIRTAIQCLDGLMTTPQLVVYDETGANRMDVVYNAESGIFEEQTSAIVMPEEERNVVFKALESYAGFMINASGSRAGVAKYFDGSSGAYAEIIKMGSELWMNSDNGHQFQDEEILGYTKHSDTLFSVRASLNMHVRCKDGSEKDYGVKESMFFTLKNGNWVCYEMTNVDITEPVGQVRLTFCNENGQQVSSEFYETSTQTLVTPVLNVPEGKVFSGWAKVEKGENNNTIWTIVFQPDAAGIAYLNPGFTLEPMTLYPLFENA